MFKQKNNSIEKRFLMNLFSFIKENTNENDRFVLAISGGSDSMVLMDVFQKLAKIQPLGFCVANIDHQIRKESSEEQQWLKKYCEKNKIPFYAETVNIKVIKRSLGAKKSLEQLARDERHTLLNKVKKTFNAKWIVTAHHQNDLLETFFLRLIRGTGLNGINTMNSVEGDILRPFLSYSKHDICVYIKEKELIFFKDITNEDTRFLRNKVRHRLIPFILDEFGTEVKDIFIRDLENLKNADRVLCEMMGQDLQKAHFSSNSVEINQEHLRHKSVSYLRELFIRMYQQWYGSPVGLTNKKVEDICSRLSEKGDFEITISRSVRFLRSNDFVGFDKNMKVIQKSENHEVLLGEDFKKKLEKKNVINLDLDLFNQDETVCFQLLSYEQEKSFCKSAGNDNAYLDYDKVQFPLKIRLWRDGDRIKPLGMEEFKRISRLMTNAGIKKYAKRKQLILENGKHDIIWCMGLRISEDYKITPNTVRCLKIIYNI